MFPKLQLKNLLWNRGTKRRMDDDASRRTQRRQSDSICQACKIISRVQCRAGNEGKNEKTDDENCDRECIQQRECESCHRIFECREFEDDSEYELDCYPYTFSPLLLFAQESYFDKGYSNYNSVAQFFAPVLDINMLENVLHERKNMLYEELLDLVTKKRMLVTCCIDAHFTAFQVLSDKSLIYYDPMQPNLSLVTGDSYTQLVGFLLLKCNYGDSQHMQENKDYYTGSDSNSTRRMLYGIWQKINKLDIGSLYAVKFNRVALNLDRYVLINSQRDPRNMSTQMTGNTCYFQTYLFGVLCKAGCPTLGKHSSVIDLENVDKLVEATTSISHFLLEFFVQTTEKGTVMRPLTNSNVILDFYRYVDAPYYHAMTRYLQHLNLTVPDYDLQYERLLQYFVTKKTLHKYTHFSLTGEMSSTLNTKALQSVTGTDDAVFKLARANYYKYRAVNLMFGYNSGIMHGLANFCEFNALRKNQMLAFYEQLKPIIGGCGTAFPLSLSKYRDYYFMPQFEVGQQELVDVHHYSYLVDMCAMLALASKQDVNLGLVERVNQQLVEHILFSTQKRNNYEKLMKLAEFTSNKKYFNFFLATFMSVDFHQEFVGLGFSEINTREKDINSLTQTVFYSTELMGMQHYRMEAEFEKECINQMARSTLRKYESRIGGEHDMKQKYRISVKIGHGFTYTKYNTLMHFLNVVECYWQNPDLNNMQLFGKDIRTLLAICCQKIFFEKGHTYYHYGPMEIASYTNRTDLDLAVASSLGHVVPGVSRQKRGDTNELVLVDRVYEYDYLRGILAGMFSRVGGVRLKTDNPVLNLTLLSLMLDFGLYEEHADVLNLPFLLNLQSLTDKRQLQVEVANLIHEFDRKNTTDTVTRLKLELLIFEASYKFLVNKGFPVNCKQNELIQDLNIDPTYQQHLLLCKINMSLCQINKSIEVDYYKVRCNGEFKTIIPQNFSKSTGDYLEQVTKQYTFSENGGVIVYDDLPLFDLRGSSQPEIHLYKVRFDSATSVQSMVKYIEIQNSFRAANSENKYLIFIANNALWVDVSDAKDVTIRINKIAVEVATIFFNKAVSFVPCFKYVDSEDVIIFASRNIHYLVDQGGQFCTDYYGMKHELIECIRSDEVILDLNDEHIFQSSKLSELLTESKTVIYYPDYLLQVPSRQQLINLLDFAAHVRNVSFFILTLFYLRRSSVLLEYIEREDKIVKITGPWKEAIMYVLNRSPNSHYDEIFAPQFFDLNQHERLPLTDFIDVLCQNFTRYQRVTDDGQYQIVPTDKQKAFLRRIITSEECFHFSEVGSGKTKVILPLLCQTFLSNNKEAHSYFSRGGKAKDVLVILVPEHLVPDAKSQVYRYCLNLNFREEYRVYDDIFALLHDRVQLGDAPIVNRFSINRTTPRGPHAKQIFVTSFNQFKKALTYDAICTKIWPHRDHILVVADEVDDFLDRDKLVFNICSNKGNAFDRPTLELYFEVSRAAYQGESCSDGAFSSSSNPDYWKQLHEKFRAIHLEIQDASRSVNKSFGIFNEKTLRHCSSNIAHDVEGYKSLIARPYESVNRAMPGSYYSDVERTIYLTYVILIEDISKYDELFQEERKFISFEYWRSHIGQLDYDDLVYGLDRLSAIVAKYPDTKDGLTRFLYEIILRRMEIRDKSRSVNSIDIVFNFDCIGFTGTPFIDNYPTFAYIRNRRQDDIPSLIDRNFYAYTCDNLSQDQFEERFSRFQGQNSDVLVEYVPSDWMQNTSNRDEMAILEQIFVREDNMTQEALIRGSVGEQGIFNVIVDLCGIFKRSSIHDVRDLILRYYGPDRFHYIYHIDQTDSSDRVLRVNSDNDVQFDEEFYKHLCKTYGANLRDKVFFFVDNRNVIGKDIPFQLVYQRHFKQPLFEKSVVIAHDVDDFSKIWQAMGRSRTMNDTRFSIYKCGIPAEMLVSEGRGAVDIKKQDLTRLLYVLNCDSKMAGNLSSIYQTLISLLNLSQQRFYHCDDIVNSFLEKMQMTIGKKVEKHSEELIRHVLGTQVSARILAHILSDKFQRSPVEAVAAATLTPGVVETLLRQIVEQKYEQREPTGDIYDDFLRLLSGNQQRLMEISYTKQQQKQKQKQQNKSQDSDTMDIFDKKNQIHITDVTDDYFNYTLTPESDLPKIYLNLPLSVPILTMSYTLDGSYHAINVYPTLQFLYSHHIQGAYITKQVRDVLGSYNASSPDDFIQSFFETAEANLHDLSSGLDDDEGKPASTLGVGKAVVLVGLSAEELNGQHGVITRPAALEGRWDVRLHSNVDVSPRPISIKAANLQVIEPDSLRDEDLSDPVQRLAIRVRKNLIRQNPQYTLAALKQGIYVIGMKDQFNIHDLHAHPMQDQIRYIADEMGFILYEKKNGPNSDSSRNVDSFGPYFVEQYILLEILSKQEVAQNVLDYYVRHKDKLQRSLQNYSETQGKGFICWRFLINDGANDKTTTGDNVVE